MGDEGIAALDLNVVIEKFIVIEKVRRSSGLRESPGRRRTQREVSLSFRPGDAGAES